MKPIKKRCSIAGGKCLVFSPSKNREQSMAVVKQKGRYPRRGFSLNTLCTETIYVLEGRFAILYKGKKIILNKGEIFYLEPGNKYAILGEGVNLVAITPAWDKFQNKIVK
jgi:mannose-6-phosphate isomerase-like protein (cupin superfamily)